MTAPTPALSRQAWTFLAVVIVLGGAILVNAVRDVIANPVDPRWLLLAGLTVIAGLIMLRIPTTEISFSISDTFNIAAAVLFGPSAGAVTAAVDGLVLSSQFGRSYKTAYRILFNVATSAISIWLAAHLFFALAGSQIVLSGSWSAVRLMAYLALFGTVNYFVNTGLVALAIALERHIPAYQVWREHFLGLWVTYFGGVLATLPLVMISTVRQLGALEILVLIVPLPLILQTTFRHALGRAQDQLAHLNQVNRVYVQVIETLATTIDAKDQVTHDHIRRVQSEALRLAQRLGVHDDLELQAIKAAALLHDVGKISVPEHILNKPGRLSPSEFEVMKRHAPAGADILSVVGFPYPVVPIVRHHHENWDGTGYPDGIKGEAIPIGARIISVVDCFDALTSDRPYRPRLDTPTALEMIVARSGTMYDPRVVETFLQMHDLGAGRAATAAAGGAASEAAAVSVASGGGATAASDRGLQDLRAISDLGRAIAAAASDQQWADTLWSHLRARMPATSLVFYRYEQASDTIVAAHAAGTDADTLRGARIAVGDRLSGWVAATRETIANSDARLDLDEAQRDRSPLRSALAVPIEADGRLLGVLSLYAPAVNAFDDDHRRLAQAAVYAAASLSRNSA
jgi:putative nucleotidyltransferase with HDIG domain